MILFAPIFGWTFHAFGHCASEGAQKFALISYFPVRDVAKTIPATNIIGR
jgi:hypothetical protein